MDKVEDIKVILPQIVFVSHTDYDILDSKTSDTPTVNVQEKHVEAGQGDVSSDQLDSNTGLQGQSAAENEPSKDHPGKR